jgi:glutamyl-Q tRNA(Asp) synthetase
MEDLDGPRVVSGSARRILETLRSFGFEWDGDVVNQSERAERYADALRTLRSRGLTFECSCTRSQLADEERYPGHCRDRELTHTAVIPTATRLRVPPGPVQFSDRIQGIFRQDVASVVGDIALRRRDQIVAYVLAVVLDDAAQEVTHIVRGADLLDNTPRQIHLQTVFGFATPRYAHVPVLMEANGAKLAKSARSVAIDATSVNSQLLAVLEMLGMSPPRELRGADVAEVWRWAIAHWDITSVPRRLSYRLEQKDA